jgi:hypothetical protein
MQQVRDDEQIQIVPTTICLIIFLSSYDYLVYHEGEESCAPLSDHIDLPMTLIIKPRIINVF